MRVSGVGWFQFAETEPAEKWPAEKWPGNNILYLCACIFQLLKIDLFI